MVKEILYKLFNIEPFPCASCETLKQQLSEANAEKRSLLEVILEKNSTKIELAPVIDISNMKPVGSKFSPWKVRQQTLEAEDREKAKVLNRIKEEEEQLKKKNPIESLEEEVLTAKTNA